MEVPASLAGRRIRPADYLVWRSPVTGLRPAAVTFCAYKLFAPANRHRRGNADGNGVPLLLASRAAASRRGAAATGVWRGGG